MKTTKDLFDSSESPLEFVSGYFEHLHELIKAVDHKTIVAFLERLIEAREKEQTIYFIGNGGSAATSSHFANDIGLGSRCLNKPFKAISLTDNNAVMTAIGNDYGYEELFKKQLQTLLKKDDVVVAISASGNSENLLRAIDYAKGKGATTVGLTGFDGGKLKISVDISVHIPSGKGEYGPVEDFHMIIDHLVANYLLNKFREDA